MTVKKNTTIKSIWIAVITAVITSIIVSLINYTIWLRQNTVQQNQSLNDYKIQLLEKITKSSYNMMSLCEHRAKIRIEYAKERVKILDSLKSKERELPSPYSEQLFNKLKRKFPLSYSGFEESYKADDDFSANCILIRAFYSSKVIEHLDELEKSFVDKTIEEFTNNKVKKENILLVNLNTVDVTVPLGKYQWEQLVLTVDEMGREIEHSNLKE